MAKVVEVEETRFVDPDSFEAQVSEYAKVKASIDIMETRSKELREKLMERLDLGGMEDDKGNILLDVPGAAGGIARIEKQRRATRKLNEGAAEMIIEAAGLEDSLYEMKRVINEDALMAAFYEGTITEEQLDEMFPVSVTWALRTVKK